MRTLATYRLVGPSEARASTVTDRLGLPPRVVVEAGEPVGRRGPARTEPLWSVSSAAQVETGVELSEQLVRLLDLLEPRADELWRLAGEGWEATWFCYLGSGSTEHAAELDRDLLSRMVRLPGDLWLDVYPDDED